MSHLRTYAYSIVAVTLFSSSIFADLEFDFTIEKFMERYNRYEKKRRIDEEIKIIHEIDSEELVREEFINVRLEPKGNFRLTVHIGAQKATRKVVSITWLISNREFAVSALATSLRMLSAIEDPIMEIDEMAHMGLKTGLMDLLVYDLDEPKLSREAESIYNRVSYKFIRNVYAPFIGFAVPVSEDDAIPSGFNPPKIDYDLLYERVEKMYIPMAAAMCPDFEFDGFGFTIRTNFEDAYKELLDSVKGVETRLEYYETLHHLILANYFEHGGFEKKQKRCKAVFSSYNNARKQGYSMTDSFILGIYPSFAY